MKKTLITLLSLAAFCVPLAATAYDDANDKRDRKATREDRPARAIDGEGKRGKRPDFASMTAKERLVAIKKRMKGNPKMAEMLMKRFDKDENGKLSDAELTKAGEAMAKRGGKGAKGKGREGADGKRKGKGKGPRGKRQDK